MISKLTFQSSQHTLDFAYMLYDMFGFKVEHINDLMVCTKDEGE